MSALHTILALCRPAYLPTVWSNCLAGWWLGDGGDWRRLLLLMAGATLLFLGGAFLNDAFDAPYDAQHRRTRPIPGGAVSQQTVWRWGAGLLAAGELTLLGLGNLTGGLALGVVVLVILYNVFHRLVTFSPALLGLCRLFLYLMGASVAVSGITGWSIWCGLALGTYVAGVGCFARWERTPTLLRYWPITLLAVPILLALMMNPGRYLESALLLSAIVVLWALRCMRQLFWSSDRSLSGVLSGLTAGIVLVDWLAAANAPRPLSVVFIALFLVTVALQPQSG